MIVLTTVLASGTNSTSTINDVEPGLLCFLVVAALGLALVFLLRSMNKQFKKIGPKPGGPEDMALDESELDDEDSSVDPDPTAVKRR